MYCSSGGIGFLTVGADLAEVDTFGMEPLRLMSGGTRKETLLDVPAPNGGWTTQSLLTTVAQHEQLIDQKAPVDAYLGTTWIGSTEL